MEVTHAEEPKAIFVDGRSWLACPVGGPSCFRVVADLGRLAVDAVEFHVENHYLGRCCVSCGR